MVFSNLTEHRQSHGTRAAQNILLGIRRPKETLPGASPPGSPSFPNSFHLIKPVDDFAHNILLTAPWCP